jgi:hypothetical protein
MRKSHFNDEFLVMLGPIIRRLFTCSNAEKNKIKKQRVLALVLSLWVEHLPQHPKVKGSGLAPLLALEDRKWHCVSYQTILLIDIVY